jgi:hypothetical protein
MILADERPPNIVFLLADDQRYDGLSFTGNTILETPRIGPDMVMTAALLECLTMSRFLIPQR